ncbi:MULTISPECIES: LLM class oxidoreductase [Bradyrhizobium]|uniref:hypothetical protein n=1 Tax=Bradyrhizobium centrosematis TaxID=1300039 RepID=UPI00216954A1|nr:hypothetical protein [Bradyrhizobium centrosematis]MCS3765487.1 hypothetical protein [Bradyrhizobium centrosematis]MCS3778021.1 hypothetical protein [Bradyrhizobium centrosematis]
MPDKKLHLAAFVSAGPVSGSHVGWRHPKAGGDLLSAAYYQNIGWLLEQGRFDLLFIADILATPDALGGSLHSQLRYGALGPLRLDPLVVLSIITGAIKHLVSARPFDILRPTLCAGARSRGSIISAVAAPPGISSTSSRRRKRAILI